MRARDPGLNTCKGFSQVLLRRCLGEDQSVSLSVGFEFEHEIVVSLVIQDAHLLICLFKRRFECSEPKSRHLEPTEFERFIETFECNGEAQLFIKACVCDEVLWP